MSRIAAQGTDDHQQLATRILAWVTFSSRPLTVKELQHALAIDIEHDRFDEDMIFESSDIISWCAGLITIDNASRVSLVHYTTKRYLEERAQLHFPRAQNDITHSCAIYLASPELRLLWLQELMRDHPFVAYASRYLGHHARLIPDGEIQPQVLHALSRLFNNTETRKLWLQLHQRFQDFHGGSTTVVHQNVNNQDNALSTQKPPLHANASTSKGSTYADCEIGMVEVTALHLAASMGVTQLVATLIHGGCDINAVDESGKTALDVALDRGFGKTAEVLAKNGARIDLRDERGQKLLLRAVEGAWDKLGDIICNAALNAGETTSHPALLLQAAYTDKAEVVARLANSSQVDLKGSDKRLGENALFVATEMNAISTVKELVSQGVSVNARDDGGRASLHRATKRGYVSLVSALLMAGAWVDPREAGGRTPWSANIKYLNDAVLKVLIDAGANPNTKAPNGVSELYSAAAGGNVDVVRYMLKAGTDPSIRTDFGWTPLHWAGHNGHIECVELLIDAGADINAVSDQHATPLDLATQVNAVHSIEILKKAGALQHGQLVTLPSSLPKATERKIGNDGIDSHNITTVGIGLGNLEPEEPAMINLTFDQPLGQVTVFGQFVYEQLGAKNFNISPFQISHPLTSMIKTLGVGRVTRRAEMSEYPLPPERFNKARLLCTIDREDTEAAFMRLKFMRTVSEHGLYMTRSWDGCWTVREEDVQDGKKRLLQTRCIYSDTHKTVRRSEWTNTTGSVIGQTFGHREHSLSVDKHLGGEALEQLVVSWIAKVWYETLEQLEIVTND